MKKVIFICKGNRHRSVVAAALYNLLKKDDSFAESYGTLAKAEGNAGLKVSSFPDFAPLINYLKNNFGIDISNHICAQVTPEVLEGADKIIVIAEENSIPDWLRKYKYEHWYIVDDFSTPEILENDVETIKAKVEGLI